MRAMKTNLSTNDMQDALARVEKARGNRTNAARRLTRAQASVEAAVKDVAEAEEEFKAAAAHLDQTVRKGMSLALKKGGTDASIALAEIIARSLSATSDDGGETPQSDPEPQPQPEPQADAGKARTEPSKPAPKTSTDGDDAGEAAEPDLLGNAG